MIVKHPRVNWTSVLLAVIASAQILTLAMVGHIYLRVQKVASAFAAAPKLISPKGSSQPAESAAPRRKSERASAIPASLAPRQATPVSSLNLESIDTRPTEQNSSWWRYAWVATLSNSSSERQTFQLRIQWLDDSNFVIDDTIARGLSIAPGTTETFTGYDLITSGPAARVAKVKAFIE